VRRRRAARAAAAAAAPPPPCAAAAAAGRVAMLLLVSVVAIILICSLPVNSQDRVVAGANAQNCETLRVGLASQCDGHRDVTAQIQDGLRSCAAAGLPLTLPAGKICMSYPLILPFNAVLSIPSGTVLKAGPSSGWPNVSSTVSQSHHDGGQPMGPCTPGGHEFDAQPFISTAAGAENISILGPGTIDGSGAQWWTGNNKTPCRPKMLKMDAKHVLLHSFLLLNGAAWHTSLSGEHYRIYGVRIRSPPYHIAPNTDGLDISAKYVHIRDADIMNGDDSICMKSPAQSILVENSIVRQGNGLVVGTSGDALFRNISFKNCTAIGTAFGAHIKFKDTQVGSVTDILFEDILIVNATRYAIGINQNGQSLPSESQQRERSNVTVNNVTYRRITAIPAPVLAKQPAMLSGKFEW
jgi:polygalacturonase